MLSTTPVVYLSCCAIGGAWYESGGCDDGELVDSGLLKSRNRTRGWDPGALRLENLPGSGSQQLSFVAHVFTFGPRDQGQRTPGRSPGGYW